MREKKGKILGTLVFLLLILCILFLTFFPAKKNSHGELKMVEINGNVLLSENDYLTFTKLNEQGTISSVSLPVIKDRIEKHPYVAKADVEASGNTATVLLSEKTLEAVLLVNGQAWFISSDFQLLPMFSDTKYEGLPVISNAADITSAEPLSVVNSSDVKEAFKIIEAAKRTNKNIYKRLSEINLRNGGDIVLSFTEIKTPVIFGRGEEAKKMVYLDIMWEGIIEGNTLVQQSDYIDLRFAGEVYIGKNDTI